MRSSSSNQIGSSRVYIVLSQNLVRGQAQHCGNNSIYWLIGCYAEVNIVDVDSENPDSTREIIMFCDSTTEETETEDDASGQTTESDTETAVASTQNETAKGCANPDNATWQKGHATGNLQDNSDVDLYMVGHISQNKPNCNEDLLNCPVATADDCPDRECVKQKCINLVKAQKPDANGASVINNPLDYLSVLCLT